MKKKFFELARKLSMKSDNVKHQLGAVLVRKNRILGIGFNQNKTHPKSPHSFKHLHAEIDCLFSAGPDDIKGSTMYIYREKKDGKLGLARSCPSCLAALKRHGIKKICYTTYTGYFSEEL